MSRATRPPKVGRSFLKGCSTWQILPCTSIAGYENPPKKSVGTSWCSHRQLDITWPEAPQKSLEVFSLKRGKRQSLSHVPAFTFSSKKSNFCLSLHFPFTTHKHPTPISLRLLFFFLIFFLSYHTTETFVLHRFCHSDRASHQCVPQKPECSDSAGQGFIPTIRPAVRAD